MEASNVARSSRLQRARQSRSITPPWEDESSAEAGLHNQADSLHAEVRAMLDEALDWELGVCAGDNALTGPKFAR